MKKNIIIIHFVIISVSQLLTSSGFSQKRVKEAQATLIIRMQDAAAGDTIRMMLFDRIYDPLVDVRQPGKEYFAIKDVNGNFIFRIRVKGDARYFSLSKERVTLNRWPEPYVNMLRRYIVEPGDQVKINVQLDSTYHANENFVNSAQYGKIPEIRSSPTLKYKKQYRFSFTGNFAAKYRLKYRLDKLKDSIFDHTRTDEAGNLKPSEPIVEGMKLMRQYRPLIKPDIFEWMLADFIGERESVRLKLLSYQPPLKSQLYQEAANLKIPKKAILNSVYYPSFLADKYRSMYTIGRDSAQDGPYFHIKRDYQAGELRDKIMYIYLAEYLPRLPANVLPDALGSISSDFYLNLVKGFSDSLSPGRLAYDFDLPAYNGKHVKLSDFKGKIVFIDFWFTGCSACKGYFQQSISKVEEKFVNDSNVVFITISIDRVLDEWTKSAKSGAYTSDKAINLFTAGKSATHPVIARYGVKAFPRPVLIDRNGRIITDKNADLIDGGAQTLIGTINKALVRNQGL